ncbi:hypothetical protein BC938DRAFT_479858 [Jimgerdemannia flammicorona]|uniref:Uncharacterized protein n=1 Tax=Jimgerdemannia flammicorona TaxID=994334 RepID=A0A433QK11_9FUNG|nr:hypothetical protein BC938DRAFT_479858 [Jimgerdemannia flammicorona]
MFVVDFPSKSQPATQTHSSLLSPAPPNATNIHGTQHHRRRPHLAGTGSGHPMVELRPCPRADRRHPRPRHARLVCLRHEYKDRPLVRLPLRQEGSDDPNEGARFADDTHSLACV